MRGSGSGVSKMMCFMFCAAKLQIISDMSHYSLKWQVIALVGEVRVVLWNVTWSGLWSWSVGLAV